MNVKQYAFVTAYLKHRDPVIAYKLATGSESANLRSLQSAANRMLNKPGVREEIQSVLKATRAEVEAEMAETMRTELMTIERKRTILAMIINGQYTVMVRAKGKNCSPCTYFNSPTISQVLAGIREDNKMAGHYAVVTTRPNKKMQQYSTTPCPPLAGESRSDGGGILGPDGEMQQSSTTPPGESPLQGDRGTLAQDTREMQQSSTTLCPPLAGESRSDGGGILEPDSEMQQSSTTPSESPLQGDRGILAPDPRETHQITTTTNHESPLSTEWRGAGGEVLEPDPREMQQSSTTTVSPLQGDLGVKTAQDKPLTTSRLKKLLTKTTSLANAPIPASLRPFFDAIEMQQPNPNP